MTCDSLLKFHQGTRSPDALTNNLHELVYNIRCTYADNGAVVETHFSALLPIGHPGGFTGTDCGSGTHEHNSVGPVTPADAPNAGFDGRFILDSDCATAVAAAQKQIFTMNEFWVTGVVAKAGQLRNFQLFPVFFVANPSRYFDPNGTNKIGRQIDLCYQGAAGFPCDQVRRQTGTGPHMAYDDPHSPFNGAQRDFSPGLFVVQNDGPTTVYTDVFARRFSTTPFPGAIQQYIAGSRTGDRSQGTIRGTFTNFASNAADKVHAPN